MPSKQQQQQQQQHSGGYDPEWMDLIDPRCSAPPSPFFTTNNPIQYRPSGSNNQPYIQDPRFTAPMSPMIIPCVQLSPTVASKTACSHPNASPSARIALSQAPHAEPPHQPGPAQQDSPKAPLPALGLVLSPRPSLKQVK